MTDIPKPEHPWKGVEGIRAEERERIAGLLRTRAQITQDECWDEGPCEVAAGYKYAAYRVEKDKW